MWVLPKHHRHALSSSSKTGFTIVELLIVVVVIAILAAITIVAYNGIQSRAKASATQVASKQAYKALVSYAVQNADVLPTNLSQVGITNSGATTFEYHYDNAANPKTFCVTATTANVSYYVSSTIDTPTAGGCAGHGVNGVAAITNMAYDPRATGSVTAEWAARYGTTRSFVTGAGDGPFAGMNTYMRQTFTTAATGGGRGIDYRGNIDVTNPAADTAWPVTAGTPVTASVYVRASISNTDSYMACRINNGSGTWLSNTFYSGSVNYTANTWIRKSLTFTPDQTGYMICTARFQTSINWTLNATIDSTALMITTNSSLHNYADGSSPGWIWNGTANNAMSSGAPL